ncbi:MAG: carboxypeptidase regulatory-like domain-containing protein, partial [Sphingobacteriales bacterium]
MRNYGSNFYYRRSFRIKNRPDEIQKLSKQTTSLTCFPEGGDMVTGLKSRVAFKAIGANGLGVNVSGTIIDDKGKTVSTITSEHLGMGRFEFIPEPERRYFAEIFENQKQRFQLPDSKPNGYIMEVNSSTDSLQLRITWSPELSNESLLTLIGAQDGITRYVAKVNPSENVFITSIPKTKFYTGIVQFTLFGADGLPVAERLSFCNNHDLLKIEAEIKSAYNKKDPFTFPVNLKNTDGKADIGSLSISVYNESIYASDDDDETSIYSDLLLTTDLRGYIEKPGYYFGKADEKNRARNLDNLLLTQGWRRFSWRDKLSKNLPGISNTETIDNEIKGKVVLANGKPYVNGDVTLFQSGLTRNILQTKTDTAGNFIFKDLNIIDTANFVISTNTAKEKKNYKIQVFGLEDNQEEITRPDQRQEVNIMADSLSAENKKLDDLYLKSKGISLAQINIIAKKATPVKESANLNGPGKADAIVLAKDLETTHDLST